MESPRKRKREKATRKRKSDGHSPPIQPPPPPHLHPPPAMHSPPPCSCCVQIKSMQNRLLSLCTVALAFNPSLRLPPAPSALAHAPLLQLHRVPLPCASITQRRRDGIKSKERVGDKSGRGEGGGRLGAGSVTDYMGVQHAAVDVSQRSFGLHRRTVAGGRGARGARRRDRARRVMRGARRWRRGKGRGRRRRKNAFDD